MRSKPKKTIPAGKTYEPKSSGLAFGRENYILVVIGLIFIVIGFVLMTGGGSDDPNVFNEAIFSFRRITLAPILVLIGLAIELYAILKKPSSSL